MLERTSTPRRGAFTIVELLLVLLIVAMLIGLLLVSFTTFQRQARTTAARQDVVSIRIAIEQFRNDFGFIPPLVKDGKYPGLPQDDPIDPQTNSPRVYSRTVPADLAYLRGQGIDSSSTNPDSGDYRYSEYSLAYYLLGALGAQADGVEGPGFTRPRPDGSFDLASPVRTQPLYDPGSAGSVVIQDLTIGRVAIHDRFGTPYRFYRWEQGRPAGGQMGQIVDLRDLNVPKILGHPDDDDPTSEEPAKSSMELRQATYAIVSAGPSRVFGDIPTETLSQMEQAMGRTFLTGLDAERAARADNVAEVGR